MASVREEVDGEAPPSSAEAGKRRGRRAGLAGAATALALAVFKAKSLLGLLLTNGKLLLLGLTKLPTLLSMLVYASWSTGRGVALGIGVVASIYVHEMGHVAALRRYGIAASPPMFVPGLGAFVRLGRGPLDPREDARTGLAGPLWGLGAAIVAAGIGFAMSAPTAYSVASLGGSINLLNLIPVWQLDGARGIHPLTRNERLALAAIALAMALVTRQWVPAIVGVGLAVRALIDQKPARGDRRVTWLFGSLLIMHSVIAMLPVTH